MDRSDEYYLWERKIDTWPRHMDRYLALPRDRATANGHRADFPRRSSVIFVWIFDMIAFVFARRLRAELCGRLLEKYIGLDSITILHVVA